MQVFMSYVFNEVLVPMDGFGKEIKDKSMFEGRRSMTRKDRLCLPKWSNQYFLARGKARAMKNMNLLGRILKGRPLHYALLMDRLCVGYSTTHFSAVDVASWYCTNKEKQDGFSVNDGKRCHELVVDTDHLRNGGEEDESTESTETEDEED